MEDPDAPAKGEVEHPLVHWILFNVNPAVGMAPERARAGVETERADRL